MDIEREKNYFVSWQILFHWPLLSITEKHRFTRGVKNLC